MAKNFAKLELVIYNEKKVIIIKESPVKEIKERILYFINQCIEKDEENKDNISIVKIIKEALAMLKEITGLSDHELDDLTPSDIDEIRCCFLEANKVFFRGLAWIGLSRKLEGLLKQSIEQMGTPQLENPKVA
jgi:hypothetical protein